MADEESVQVEDFAEQLDWGDGWTRVIEDNGHPRAWPNDRIQEGTFTAEVYDKENEKIHLSALLLEKTTDGTMRRIDWLTKYGVVSFIHGLTKLGFVHIGKPLGWKQDGHRIKGRFGYLKGSEMMDFIYKTYVQPMGTKAGYSIGGTKLQKDCLQSGGVVQCDITKIDSWEIAWTPDAMNQDSDVEKNNSMAKSGVDFMEMLKSHDKLMKAEGQVDPDETKLPGKKIKPLAMKTKGDPPSVPDMDDDEFEKGIASMIKAKRYLKKDEVQKLHDEEEDPQPPKPEPIDDEENINKIISKDDSGRTRIDMLLEKCGHSRDYVSFLMEKGMDVDQAVKVLAKSITYIAGENRLNKGSLCQCKECGYAMLSSKKCTEELCPVCGSEMRVTIYPQTNQSITKTDGENMPEGETDREKKQEILEEPPTPEPEEPEKDEDDITKSELWKGLKTLEKAIVTMQKANDSNMTMLKDIQGKLTKSEDMKKDDVQDEDTLKLEKKPEKPSGEVAPGEEISFKKGQDGVIPVESMSDEVLMKTALARHFKIEGYGSGIADNKPDGISRPVAGVNPDATSGGDDMYKIAIAGLERAKGVPTPSPTNK